LWYFGALASKSTVDYRVHFKFKAEVLRQAFWVK